MGGGDLNLKKSWHPSTLRNIERVWKAEQKHEAEQKKIEQLQRELADERNKEEIRHFAEDQGVLKKKSERLDWMYQGPGALVDKEQYLLGRKVDKTFELVHQQEQGTQQQEFNDETPGSIFNTASGNATVDLANKIREDPLFAIRKKEEEQKKRLLDNPVKMKQLQNLLKQSLSKKSKKKKKKSKKKSKKRQRKSSDESSSSDSGDEEMSNRYKHDSDTKKHHSKKFPKDSINGKSFSHVKTEERDSDSDDERRKRKSRQYGLIVPHSRNASQVTESRKQKSRDRSPVHDHKSRKDDYGKKHHKSSENAKYSQGKHNYQNDISKRKLNEKEMELRRQEMMNNAKWREQQRKQNIKHYKEEDEKQNFSEKKKMSEFINPLLAEAASKGSVEKSVKQKMYNIQRSEGGMSRNFLRR